MIAITAMVSSALGAGLGEAIHQAVVAIRDHFGWTNPSLYIATNISFDKYHSLPEHECISTSPDT